MHFRAFVVLPLVLTACSSTMTPRSTSRDEIVAYVNRAAEVVAANGANACDTLATSRWKSGDWYVFVLAADGRTVCHAAQPQMVGRMAHDLVDADGKRFGDEFMRVGGEGSGWVEYRWTRPNDGAHVAKTSYVRSVKDRDGNVYVIGSGGYELP